ncbi:RNA polymerase sigma-70 factor, ECF subfamily [Oceanobacillus limi]|uniref:RNA polymerase sigma-70 factor, ECF subfamily n=1 Tax=Oceanobacillus limi TaxID=930131 RepID=A0A1H9Y419_9BACI|nr:RNA polymerase sigma factor [Oceanobacillus limi]SES63432.1 RNA polymerase sigma-70 factor, ECF subfamily [Oceanobacillus limi]
MDNRVLFEELNTELNIVYKYLVRKGIPHIDAEDAVQEAAYKYLKFFDSIQASKVRSWLIRVSLNNYYDQCRKNKKYILNFEENRNEEDKSELPEFILLAKERTEELNQLLSKMKPQYAELLLLKYQSNLSYIEISELLGIRKSTIKTNLFRARKKLVKLYKEEHDGRE